MGRGPSVNLGMRRHLIDPTRPPTTLAAAWRRERHAVRGGQRAVSPARLRAEAWRVRDMLDALPWIKAHWLARGRHPNVRPLMVRALRYREALVETGLPQDVQLAWRINDALAELEQRPRYGDSASI